MSTDPQSRAWQLTINHPEEHGVTHDTIRPAINELKSVLYFCMADEIGSEEKTPHTHIYIAAKSGIRFSTLKKRFPAAHIEQARGNPSENRAYIRKDGDKYADKAETSVPETFEEFGDLPPDLQQGYRSDIAQLYNMILDGMSNAEIMAANPDLATHISQMDKIRQDILEAEYREQFRQLSVTYIFGPTETGKTRYVMEKQGYSSVYRITDYDHPFDRYHSEPAICFDEFRSSLKIQDMLMYLDGYPLNLPARYAQRAACYTEVYIISNIDLKEQYRNIQMSELATWQALVRRIGKVIEFTCENPPIDHGSAHDYLYPPIPDWVKEANSTDQIENLQLEGE